MTEGAGPAIGQDVAPDVDVVVVGAGFAGLYAVHRLRQLGFSVQGFEAAGGVGGTWWWNRYPGARCDIESIDYSYSFSPELEREWVWSERYAGQPEILAYLEHVADRFDLRRSFRFNTTVERLGWDEHHRVWGVEPSTGPSVRARWCILAVGCLSSTKDPEVEGIERFEGAVYHTGRWPHAGVDVSGQRVGVIGTGSSGIQCIPLLAEQAAHLTVFQRTPNFSMPAHNRALPRDEHPARVAALAERRVQARVSHGGVPVTPPSNSALGVDDEERRDAFGRAWEAGELYALLATYNDLLVDRDANETAAEYLRERIRAIVQDPAVAERLSPRSYPVGTKRLCLDTGYYETFNRDDVTLVDLRETPFQEVTARGMRTSAGEHELDVLVLATGFDAMTGPLLAIDPRGVDGRSLREAWADGPRTYLGLAISGFPNLFTVTGPGSPSVLSNMAMSIEQHVEWITDCLADLRERQATRLEAEHGAQESWTDHVTDIAGYTLFPTAASWYMGANVPGKPRVFMPYLAGLGAYRQVCDGVRADGYRGFSIA